MYIYIRTSEQNQTTSSFESLINKIVAPTPPPPLSSSAICWVSSKVGKLIRKIQAFLFLGEHNIRALKMKKRKKKEMAEKGRE
jgi:hypothetical protein